MPELLRVSKFDISEEALRVIKTLQSHDYSAYLVGGCVRDLLMGKTPHDWDICTNALPEEVAGCFTKTIPTGVQHGTISVNINHTLYEVTTYRYGEVYDDSHKPLSVSFNRNKDGVYQDLSRRDFTVNAMAYDPISQNMVDPYNGRKDLEAGIIKAVGDAHMRFTEDPLRMLRAIRFSCYFDNFKIDKKTFNAISDEKYRLNVISSERIYSEMTKMLISDSVGNMMNLHYSGIDEVFFPEFARACECTQNNPHHNASVGLHTINTVKNCKNNSMLRFAALFHDLSKPECKTMNSSGDHFYGHPETSADIADNIMDRWKFSTADRKNIHNLVLKHDTLGNDENRNWNLILKKLMCKYGETFVADLLELSKADTLAQSKMAIDNKLPILDKIENEFYNGILANNEPYTISNLDVNGNDILDRGYTGEMVGGILNYMLNDVMKHPEHNNREHLLTDSNLKHYASNARQKLESQKIKICKDSEIKELYDTISGIKGKYYEDSSEDIENEKDEVWE